MKYPDAAESRCFGTVVYSFFLCRQSLGLLTLRDILRLAKFGSIWQVIVVNDQI